MSRRPAWLVRARPEASSLVIKVVELTNELGLVTRRLQKRVLEQKRQQVYADGQRALANMPLDEFRARSKVEHWGKLGLSYC